MSSSANWKKYGGINKHEKMNNLNVTSIVTDSLTLRHAYVGAFDICGNVTISEKLYVNKKTSFNDNIYVKANVDISKNVIIDGNILVNGNSTFTNAQSVFYNNVYLGQDKAQYLYGNPNGIGVNIQNPNATLDICGNRVEVLNVFSDLSSNRNIIARNMNKQGIVVSVDNSNSTIDFFNDVSVNPLNMYDGRIQYQKGGIMVVDVSDNTFVASKLSVSNRDASAHIMGETAVIYDICNNTYAYNVYDISSSNTGNAVSLIASDNSSNTFLNIITPGKNGLSIGGGAYPLDASKAMGTIGLCDASGVYRSTQNIVRGSSTVKYKTTLGINTHAPRIDKYVVDINGPMHLTNGELTNVSSNNFQINNIVFSRTNKNYGLAFGAPYSVTPGNYAHQILYTQNGGISWSKSRIVDNFSGTHTTDLELQYNEFRAGYMYDPNYAIIGGDKGYLFYTNNGGQLWNNIIFQDGSNSPIKGLYIGESDSSPSTDYKRFVVLYTSTIIIFDLTLTELNTNINSTIKIAKDNYTKVDINGESFKSMHGNGNYAYMVGSSIYKYNNISKTASSSHTLTNLPNISYNSVYAYDNNFVIAVGDKIISYTQNGGTSWTDITTNTDGLAIQSITLNSVYILDDSNAIAVGNNGIIVYTSDRAVTWKTAANDIMNSSGNGNRLVNSNYKLNGIVMQDINTFLVSTLIRPYASNVDTGKTNIMYCFFPNLMNRVNNYVFDVSGNMGMDGDIRINSGTIMIKDATPSTSATTGALQVTGGAGIVGNTYINGNLVVNNLIDPATNGLRGALTIPNGGMYIGGNVEIGGNVIFRKELKVIGKSDNDKDVTFNSGTAAISPDITNNYTRPVKGAIVVTGGGGVYISGNTYCGGEWLDISGNATVNNLLQVNNLLKSVNISVTGDADSNNLDSGALKVTAGGASIFGNTHIGGNLKVYTNSIIEGTSSTTGVATFLNDISSNRTVFFNNTVDSDNTTNGTLVVKGGVGIDKNVNIGGTTIIRKTTKATLYNNAALVVYGGVGIGSSIDVSGNSKVSGNSNIDKNCTIDGNTVVRGNITINSYDVSAVRIENGGLYVGGTSSAGTSTTGALRIPNGGASIGGNLFVNGNTPSDAIGNGSLVVTGGVGISENIYVGGRANIAANADVTGNFNLTGIARLTNTAISRTYLEGALVVSGGVGIAGNINIGDPGSPNNTTNTINGSVVINCNTQCNDFTNNFTNQNGFLTGALTVAGGLGIAKNASIRGTLFVNNNTTSLDNSGGALVVVGGAGIMENMNVGGNTTIKGGANSTDSTSSGTGALIVKGGVGIGKSVFIDGSTTIKGGANSTDSTSSGTGALIVNGGVGIGKSVFIDGSTTIKGGVNNADSTSSGTGALIVNGGVGIGKSVFIDGSTTIKGGANSTDSTSSGTGALIVNGGVGIGKSVFIDGSTTIKGGVNNADSTSSGTGALIVNGGVGIGKSVFIGGNTTIQGGVNNADSTSSGTGALIVNGGVGIGKSVFIGGSTTIQGGANSTDSTSSGTGALIVNGGVGIGKSVFIGGSTTIQGGANSTDSTNSSTGALIVNGGVGIGKSVFIGGSTTIQGGANSTDSTNSSTGALIVNGGVGIGKSVFIGGNASATAYYATSDYRIKSNVKKLDDTFSIDKLEPVAYFNNMSERDDVGFIAHKVQEIYPFLVHGEKDAAEYQTLNYNGIIGILVREIQELKQKVNELEKRFIH